MWQELHEVAQDGSAQACCTCLERAMVSSHQRIQFTLQDTCWLQFLRVCCLRTVPLMHASMHVVAAGDSVAERADNKRILWPLGQRLQSTQARARPEHASRDTSSAATLHVPTRLHFILHLSRSASQHWHPLATFAGRTNLALVQENVIAGRLLAMHHAQA